MLKVFEVRFDFNSHDAVPDRKTIYYAVGFTDAIFGSVLCGTTQVQALTCP